MSRLFITILNMSYTASIVILVVLLLRMVLKRAPRIFSYALWMVVLLRLLCPFSFHANWGIIPAEKFVEVEAGTNFWIWENSGKAMEGLREIYHVYNLYAPEGIAKEGNVDYIWHDGEEYSLKKINRIFFEAGKMWGNAGKIWLAGAVLLILYGCFSYHILAVRLRKCTKNKMIKSEAEDGSFTIVISDEVKTPFVAGAGLMRFALIAAPVKPVIYLPEGLDEIQRKLILEHEKMHIRHRDHLIKPIAYLAVCLHWFNPLVWIAFHFMEQDMEISCDEAVLRKTGYENKKEYARTVLAFSGQSGPKFVYPIAFGESSVKTRIKNAVKMKESKKWVIVAATVGVIAAAAILLVNGNFDQQKPSVEEAKAEIETSEEGRKGGVKGTDALVSMKSSVIALARKYEAFGLSAEIYENDYQLYYNGEPIRFFADNTNGWDSDRFSGTVFSRPASDQNGYTGVMTQYDENGTVVGLVQLSEEDLNELFGTP